jgi:ADP-ribose pyrophosphatase YjhB (NUDIX family)
MCPHPPPPLTPPLTPFSLFFHWKQGGWETDETLAAAAARETGEEAGVRGELETPPLGPFACGAANKPGRGEAHAHMFAMRVREELTTWPEGGQRARVWLPLGAALAAASHGWMRDALAAWAGRAGLGGVAADEDAAAAAIAATLGRMMTGGGAEDGGGGGAGGAGAGGDAGATRTTTA